MTELERRALMGDKKAQEECTRQGILLPCWKCGGEAEVNELHTGGKPIYAVACKKHHCGAYGAGSASVPKAIEFWNTRPAPPVGRCGECANGILDCDIITCTLDKYNHYKHDFCSEFEPKTSDKNER